MLTAEQLRARWHTPGFDPAQDAWVATDPDARIIGYAEITPQRDESWFTVRVPPEQRGRGIDEFLLRAVEARASEPPGTATLLTQVSDRNEDARRVIESAGYTTNLAFRIMTLTLDGAPPSPEWPSGIATRPFVAGRDEQATYEADEEASVDKAITGHSTLRGGRRGWGWGRRSGALVPGVGWRRGGRGGAELCRARNRHRLGGSSRRAASLAADRPGDGPAAPLLRVVPRAASAVRLSVDERSQTAATRLYERAGMATLQHYHIYTKELTPDTTRQGG
ncbi:MAG: GNAT family N-acetyltransferase [Chloroflexia bacterium]